MGYAIIIAALIAAVGSVTTTWLQVKVRRDLKPPSGGTIGEVVEKAHHEASVAAAGMTHLSREFVADRRARGITPPEGVESQP